MKPTINSMSWYLEKYGEDWAELVRAEDIRLGRNSDGSYSEPTFCSKSYESRESHWAANAINLQ